MDSEGMIPVSRQGDVGLKLGEKRKASDARRLRNERGLTRGKLDLIQTDPEQGGNEQKKRKKEKNSCPGIWFEEKFAMSS